MVDNVELLVPTRRAHVKGGGGVGGDQIRVRLGLGREVEERQRRL